MTLAGSPDPVAASDSVGVLSAEKVSKSYGKTRVLTDVDFHVRKGQINVLVGANGAGKSTLMKILSGIEAPTGGRLLLEGRPCKFNSSREAEAAGIGIVHQELRLFPDLSLSDNMFMGRERTHHGVVVAQQSQDETARSLLEQLGLNVDPRTLVRELPIGKQQLVEIARALAQQARILFLDEPTSALSAGEVETLFGVLRDLKARGVSLVYVSHRLEELLRIGDFIGVLRDGRKVADAKVADIDADWIVTQMLGVTAHAAKDHAPRKPGDEVLRVERLNLPRAGGGMLLDELSFSVSAGEVLGLYGLMGAGRTELLETIAGLRQPRDGKLTYQGAVLQQEPVRSRMRRGVVLVPEDRKGCGLVLDLSVRENMSLSSLERITRAGLWIDKDRESSPVNRMTGALGVRASGPEQPVSELSGGNQQKVVVARALLAQPKLLLLDEPTRGIDVAAKAEILVLVGKLAQEGMAILVASSEAQELLDCADRILILCKGRVVTVLPRSQATEAVMMRAAGGDGSGVSSSPIDSGQHVSSH